MGQLEPQVHFDPVELAMLLTRNHSQVHEKCHKLTEYKESYILSAFKSLKQYDSGESVFTPGPIH